MRRIGDANICVYPRSSAVSIFSNNINESEASAQSILSPPAPHGEEKPAYRQTYIMVIQV